jgi:hypothetical protein
MGVGNHLSSKPWGFNVSANVRCGTLGRLSFQSPAASPAAADYEKSGHNYVPAIRILPVAHPIVPASSSSFVRIMSPPPSDAPTPHAVVSSDFDNPFTI